MKRIGDFKPRQSFRFYGCYYIVLANGREALNLQSGYIIKLAPLADYQVEPIRLHISGEPL